MSTLTIGALTGGPGYDLEVSGICSRFAREMATCRLAQIIATAASSTHQMTHPTI